MSLLGLHGNLIFITVYTLTHFLPLSMYLLCKKESQPLRWYVNYFSYSKFCCDRNITLHCKRRMP